MKRVACPKPVFTCHRVAFARDCTHVCASDCDYGRARVVLLTVPCCAGYGHMAPVTLGGRVACIVYGFVGIPLTLSVIAALGAHFANLVSGALARWPSALLAVRVGGSNVGW